MESRRRAPRADTGSGSRGGSYAPEETRKGLMESALELFDQNGYHATSVDAIVVAAGMTKGAFYHHFESKEDVLLQIQEEYIDNRLQNCQGILEMTDDPLERLRMLISEAMIGIDQFRPQVAIFFQERRFLRGDRFASIKEKRDAVDSIYESVVRAGIQSGVIDARFHPRIASFGILGMCAWAFNWYRSSGALSVETIADELSAMVLLGLAPRD